MIPMKGMGNVIDHRGRSIEYLRISITDRCNLRCVYCMPEGGVHALGHEKILRYEEITRIVGIMAGLGIKHLRVTGGEPMARLGCLDLVRQLHSLSGIESVSMTSNGLLLCDKVEEAKRAGISALNLSIDSLKPDTYSKLTRGSDVSKALQALQKAVEAGIRTKVNVVPVRGFNESELVDLAALAKESPICVRFIELMPIGCACGLKPISQDEVLAKLTAAFGPLIIDSRKYGYGPAKYVKPEGFAGSIGLISAISHEFCDSCNRVRLTADGQLKLCLNHTRGLDLKDLLRSGVDDATLEAAIRDAIANKPKRHEFYQDNGDREMRCMNKIGG